jgi:hypothetical protein
MPPNKALHTTPVNVAKIRVSLHVSRVAVHSAVVVGRMSAWPFGGHLSSFILDELHIAIHFDF